MQRYVISSKDMFVTNGGNAFLLLHSWGPNVLKGVQPLEGAIPQAIFVFHPGPGSLQQHVWELYVTK